jgi:23S rRNA (cytosine1962-C5)-methyltransferase
VHARRRLRAAARARPRGARFDAISVDPPALAKRARDLPRAMAGYKELNLRALRLLAPAACSARRRAAPTCRRPSSSTSSPTPPPTPAARVHVLGRFGAAPDHPERLGFPESRYLKFVLLRAVD